MSILYDFKAVTDNLNEDEKKVKGYYPRVVSRGTIDTQQMLKDLSRESAAQKAELQKSLTLIQDYILKALKEGYNVSLTDFGTFSVTAESKIVEARNEIRAESIKVKGMRFRTAPNFNRQLREASFEKKNRR